MTDRVPPRTTRDAVACASRMAGVCALVLAASACTPSSPPADDPPGMVRIAGGEFWMGLDAPAFPDAAPVHRVSVRGFWMDATEVTNAEFAAFVEATGYVTVAERAPSAADFPGVPADRLVAGSIVFTPPPGAVPLDSPGRWWSYVRDANWRRPRGPGSTLDGRTDHPVVHIAYDDALAYAAWARKRLPTEAEWEFAARGGIDRAEYVWGGDPVPDGHHAANTFQGHFPDTNTGADGYASTAPVRAFPPNGYGLYGMSGNAWEWVADWYRPDYYRALASSGRIAVDPRGPASSRDPEEPGVPKRVQKGGSFLCTDEYCGRFRPGTRGKGEPSSGANHIGFRLVRDLAP
ncbi:MAG: formylglycine-generating enzyme family protein [Vicinamibacterales bacterium]